MPSLATVKTDVDAVIADIGSTTAYASVTPADIRNPINAGLKASALSLYRLLTLLLHDAGFSNYPPTINSNQG